MNIDHIHITITMNVPFDAGLSTARGVSHRTSTILRGPARHQDQENVGLHYLGGRWALNGV